ncbi:hypothetical protein [Caldimonas manganoxidans]|uniref:hypothetical protein n=1 Tax=Caldimonas manganoxidans TaxID=196015 RepID=UPI00036A05A6|nr:hypothetical protein [Caldimonas manganoxidans]
MSAPPPNRTPEQEHRDAQRELLLLRMARQRAQLRALVAPRAAAAPGPARPAGAPDLGPGDADWPAHPRLSPAFPRSQSLRWILANPKAVAVAGLVAAMALWVGPRRLGQTPVSVTRAAVGFLRGMREGLAWLQPLLPLLGLWLSRPRPARPARRPPPWPRERSPHRRPPADDSPFF